VTIGSARGVSYVEQNNKHNRLDSNMMNTYGHAEFDVDYVTTERSDKHKYVIRTDTDECIGMVNSTYTGTSHPDYFGKMREQWMDTLQPEKYDIKTRTAGNGAWALETVTFPDLKGVVETKKHKTETAMQLNYWHSINGSTSNNFVGGLIDFFCTNGMVTGDYSVLKKRNTKNFDLSTFADKAGGMIAGYSEHNAWCQRLAEKAVTTKQIELMLESIMPKRKANKMYNSAIQETHVRGCNMWAVYSAMTQYATHSDRFEFRKTNNDTQVQRQFNRNLEVAKWVEHPSFLEMAA
jgi:hypothetical protein